MFPQIISVEEVVNAKNIVKEQGLMELKNIKIGIMVETPAACLIIKDLLKVGLDFASFGTNDLTQYILAIDRNNEEVQYLHNEKNPAVLNAIKRVIRTCEEFGVESSICGQAGSDKEMVRYLMEYGITSVSVNADAAYEISKFIAELEKKMPGGKYEEKSNMEKKEKNPQIIVQKITQKAEHEIEKELHNKPMLIKQKNQKEIDPAEEIEMFRQAEKPKIPEYLAENKKNIKSDESQIHALKTLFGEYDIESLENIKKEESKEDNSENIILDIF